MWSVEKDPHYRKFSKVMGGAFGRFMIKNFNIFGRKVVKKAMGDKKPAKHIHKKKHRKW